ncbi:hypothetical protein 8F11_77 [uncultured Caudovirales phage]|uniref:Acyltransferase 3 domain-containing protein n=1 Tax=uncultured Caudovirales phage TaxID=2100421 RepID=A0A2H4IZR3_9CAUD|nr:hypothetical protein 8F11_77 [uncultured Caudovirales phage]
MKKLYYLEGVRGIAAFMVLLSHFIQVFYPALLSSEQSLVHNAIESKVPQTPLNLFYNGNFAVCIFFVLSGYVLSYRFIKKKDKTILVESATKRYFRLVLPVAVSVVFAYIILRLDLFYYGYMPGFTNATMPDFYAMEPSIFHALKEAFYGTFFENEFSYNAVLWTMYYELLGSFIVFSFLALLGNLRNRYIFYIILLVMFWNTYFIAFVLGMLLCDAFNSLDEKIINMFKSKISIILFSTTGIYLGSFPYVNYKDTIYEIIVVPELNVNYFMMSHIIGAFFILLVLLSSEILQKIFSLKVFRFLGDISFSLYLTHFIIINSLSSYIFIKLIKEGLSYNISFLITFITSLLVIFILSYLLYKYVDSKSVIFSKKIYHKFFLKNK